MSERARASEGQPRRGRVLLQVIVGAIILVVFIGTAWFLTSSYFHDWVRGRVITRLEQATGGRVEVRDLQWSLARLHCVANDVTIHGLEPAGEAPYFHADRVEFNAKILSLVQQEVGLRYLQVERPVIHLIVYPDGHTNQPTPKLGAADKPVARLFALEVDRADIRHGVLLLNDRPIPLDVSADDVEAGVTYVRAPRRYDGTVNVGRLRTAYQDVRFDSAAMVEFSLLPNQLEVKSLRLNSGQSTVEATGQAVDFAHPRGTVNYHAVLNLAEVADIVRLPQLRAGVAEITGSSTFSMEDYHAGGKVALRGVEYRDRTIRIPALNGGAEFAADKANIVVPHLFAGVLGGTVSGSAEVKNWGTAAQQGAVRLQAANVTLSRFAAAVSTRDMPLERLRPAGSVSGPVNVAWRGTPSRATAEFAFSVTPLAQPAPNELPVAATMRGAYSLAGQRLEFSELDLAARSVRLRATGTMAARSSLRFTLNAGNLRDIYPLLQQMSNASQLPAGVEGSGTFSGTLSGRLSAPEIAGRLTLDNFAVPVPLFPEGTISEPRLARFDSFSADLRYSPSQLTLSNAELRRAGEQASFNVTTGLSHGKLLDNSPLTANLSVRGFSLADIQPLFDFHYPITGTVNATLHLSGTKADPQGSGRVAVSKATLWGEPMQAIDADLVFANHQVEASNLVMSHNGARVTGAAAYNLTNAEFRFNLTGSNFNLAQFRRLQTQKVTLAGLLNFTARGSGTKEAPVVDADLHIRNLLMNGEPVGDVDATAVTSGGVMRVSGRSNFRIADLEFGGAIAMHDRFPANVKLTMRRLDVDPLLKMFLRGQITGHSAIDGVVTLSGPLRDPQLLTVNGDIAGLSADIEHVHIANDGPLRFSVADQVLRLDQFRLIGEDTKLGATGEIALTGAQTMNLRADGHMQLKLLQTFNPDLHSAGVVDFAIAARGTLSRPTLQGRATIADGAVTNINFPNGLSNVNGTLVFNQDRMQIQSLTATSGGGNLTFTGFVTYGNGVAFNVSAAGKGVRLRYPQGMSSTLDGDVRLSGTTAASTLAGAVTVTRFSMSPDFDIGLYVARARQTPELTSTASPLNNVRLSMHVTSAPDLQVSTTMAKVSGDMDLNVRGTAARPVLLGRINITDGQVTFNGATYQIDRGDIAFNNPVRIEPVINMEITTRVRDYDITLGFHGPLDHLSMDYRSDPPVPTTDIISLLAFGTTREESAMTTGPNPTFTESASNAILGQALREAQNSRVQRLFGVSRVRIAPETGGAETNPNARVTIEQQVSKDFTVTYITDLTHSASQQQVIQVEYSYSRNLSFLASRDQYGIVSVDVRIRQRKK